jgi:hypothetical protein
VRFLPTVTDNGQAATIFVGMAKFHDDEKVLDIGAWSKHNKRCDESPSCIHPPVVWTWDAPEHEKIIRGATKGTLHKFSAVFDRKVKRLLVHWEFYQRESDNGATCEIDTTRPTPLDGLPYVRSNPAGKRCYRAWEQQVIPVSTNL